MTPRPVRFLRPRPGLSGWLIASGLFAFGIAVRFVLGPWFEQTPLLPFLFVVMAIALVCGLRQGMTALVLFAICGWVFFLPHEPTARLVWRSPISAIVGFTTIGTLIVVTISALTNLVYKLDAAKLVQESLYQELQHRVANNMQFIASMLYQERRNIGDSAAADILDQASARIAAMAHLNRRLSDPMAYTKGLEPVITDMLQTAFHGLNVFVSVEIPKSPLSFNQMTAIVLLVSEAATNAAKHVFQLEKGHKFTVSISEMSAGRLRLSISDDGPGMSVPQAAAATGQRLGFRIMHGLATQLGGSLQLRGDAGTSLSVEFHAVDPG